MKKQILKTPDKMNTKQECNIESPIGDTNNKVLEERKLLGLTIERNHNDLKSNKGKCYKY